MTSKIIFGSNKLGTINDEQVQAMLKKHELGELISFERTHQGAMGQTMFVESSKGGYVLKGNPLYEGQLQEELFFIENIRERTRVIVPSPYIIDDAVEIFGWNYAVMPKLEGEHLNAETLKGRIQLGDKLKIAESIAETLRAFHRWEVTEFGELDTKTFSIIPFEHSYTDWLFHRILYWIEDAKKYSEITNEDVLWVEQLLQQSEQSFREMTRPTFVMGDFKSGNFLVGECESWKVSGVFDFTNAYFADPTSDLIKMLTYYVDHNERTVAKHLVGKYFEGTDIEMSIIQRLKVHMLHQRVLDWGAAKATNMVTWDDELAFSHWVKEYTDLVESLLV